MESGWEGLQTEFQHFMERAKNRPDHDGIFDNLKTAVVDEAMRRHSWEDKVSLMKSTAFWEVMPCSLVDIYRLFRGTTFLQIVSKHLPYYTASHMPEDSNFFSHSSENLEPNLISFMMFSPFYFIST